jgi:hypothetical protein
VTRYFCDDVSHWRNGEPRTVDVSAQVQLELGAVVDREAYRADVHEVIANVSSLGARDPAVRRAEIRRILTRTTTPTGAPVRLVDGGAGAPEVIRLPEAATRRPGDSAVSTRTDPRTELGPSLTGTFQADDLAARLADAEPRPDALAEAIRRTQPYDVRTADRVGRPWRVVITCPAPEGDPPTEHQIVFAGTGDAEQLDVFGIPASSWDLALEASASTDLVPARGTRRAERTLAGVLIGEALVAVVLACTTWVTGGLGMAAREAPGWLLFAVILGVAAMAFGAIGLFGSRTPEGNVNDTLVVRGYYDSRSEMLWISTAISIALFAAALVVAFAGPLSSDEGAIPTPTVSFTSDGARTTATVTLTASDVGIDQAPTITVRSFANRADPGTTIGSVAATGALDGRLFVHDVIGVPSGAQFLAVLVDVGGHGPATCTPLAAGDAGCTILAVPQGAHAVPTGGITSTATSTSTTVVASPTAVATASPSAVTTTSPTAATTSPSAGTTTFAPSSPVTAAP